MTIEERVDRLEKKVFGASPEKGMPGTGEKGAAGYSDRFDKVFDDLIGHEGGYVNDPADSGGATKWGVSLRFYRSRIDGGASAETIRSLTRNDAKVIYKRYFWDEPLATVGGISYTDLPVGVGEIVFNFSVNMGESRSHKLLQKALNDQGMGIGEDGVFGPNTLKAVKKANVERLISGIAVQAIFFYNRIAKGKNAKFHKGWLYRAVGAAMEAQEYRYV